MTIEKAKQGTSEDLKLELPAPGRRRKRKKTKKNARGVKPREPRFHHSCAFLCIGGGGERLAWPRGRPPGIHARYTGGDT